MARPLRIEYAGAWYHVMNRGRRKETIFFDESDYKIFVEVLKEAVEMFGIEVHAFALIPNHYHILIHTPLGNLSRAMRHINGVYTQKINFKYKIDGSLFRGRFKSILINEDEYLLELVRYIHKNPHKAGLEENLGEYKWCSHGMYMREKNVPEWLTIGTVLRLFGEHEKEARRKLEAFVKEEVPKDLVKKLESVKWPTILGGKEFKEKVKKYLEGEEIKEREIPEYKDLKRKEKLEEDQLKQLIENNKEVLEAKRSRKLLNKRRALVYVIKERTQKSHREIADMIGNITDAAVSKVYRCALDDIRNEEGCYREVKEYLGNL